MMRYCFLDLILKGSPSLVMKNNFLLLGRRYILICHSRLLLSLIIIEIVFVLEEKRISSQPSDENEIFYQEHHDREKQLSIDIYEDISCHHLTDVIKQGKIKLDQHPASAFHSLVLATNIQPCVRNCKEKKDFCYQSSSFYHLFYDSVGEYMELHFLDILKPPVLILPSSLGGNMKNVISLLSQFCYLFVGTGADPGFNASTTHQQNPNYRPFWKHLRSR